MVDLNPAARAKPPRLERESAHTPVFEEDEIKAFLGAIKLNSLLDIRDKSICSTLLYTWARVSALVALKVEDYYRRKGERWLRLQEKRGKIHEVTVHSKAREAVDHWLVASGLGTNPAAPLFPAFGKDKKKLNSGTWTARVSGGWCRPGPGRADSRNGSAATVFAQPELRNT